MERWLKPAFTLIGMEGSTADGPGFIQRLWESANSRFGEVAHLAKKDENGCPVGVWGAMSDFTRSFRPWENGFTQGLYLAGVECGEDARPPEGWTRWDMPGFVYIRVENDAPDVFPRTLEQLAKQGLPLAGAVHDLTDPTTGKNYMCFPIQRLDE
ncbi:MAG: GyrI-like domain-containing protein [Clostridia bacterium]|nr:GyrI-like domain-containing protein [Clostridia bacterium]